MRLEFRNSWETQEKSWRIPKTPDQCTKCSQKEGVVLVFFLASTIAIRLSVCVFVDVSVLYSRRCASLCDISGLPFHGICFIWHWKLLSLWLYKGLIAVPIAQINANCLVTGHLFVVLIQCIENCLLESTICCIVQ